MVPDYLRGPAAILQHTCQVETGLTDGKLHFHEFSFIKYSNPKCLISEVIKKAHSGKLPDDREFQCHLDCMVEKIGLVRKSAPISP